MPIYCANQSTASPATNPSLRVRAESFSRRRVDRHYVDQANPPESAGEATQHSMTLTARPPREVSLYFTFMSAPVWRMVTMT